MRSQMAASLRGAEADGFGIDIPLRSQIILQSGGRQAEDDPANAVEIGNEVKSNRRCATGSASVFFRRGRSHNRTGGASGTLTGRDSKQWHPALALGFLPKASVHPWLHRRAVQRERLL